MRRSEYRQPHVDGHAEFVVLIRGPVETGHTIHLVLGAAADENVVSTFANELVEAATTEEDVVAGDIVQQERIHVVAGCAVLGALLDPVVAFIARGRQVRLGALAELQRNAGEDEIIALTAKCQSDIVGHGDEVFAIPAENDVANLQRRNHVPVGDDVITDAAVEDVGAATAGDDVVASSAEHMIITGATVEAIVAGVAPERVIGVAGRDDIIASRATELDVVFARVLQVIGVGANGVRVVTDDHWRNFSAIDRDTTCRISRPCRIGIAADAVGSDYIVRGALDEIWTRIV